MQKIYVRPMSLSYGSDASNLIKLKKASEITGCNILGKAEYLNPGQSVKDRAALYMIKNAKENKKLIVEGTGGNTGIGRGQPLYMLLYVSAIVFFAFFILV